MSSVVNPADGQTENNVYPDYHANRCQLLSAHLAKKPPVEQQVHPKRTEYSEYGPTRADTEMGASHEAGNVAHDPCCQVNGNEVAGPEYAFDHRAENDETKQVRQQMEKADVQKHRQRKAPVLAFSNEWAVLGTPVDQVLNPRPPIGTPRDHDANEEQDVDRDKNAGGGSAAYTRRERLTLTGVVSQFTGTS